MGCTASHNTLPGDERPIKWEFKSTHIPRFDEYFRKATLALGSAERIRHSLQDAKEYGADMSGTWRLKEYHYIETVRVMLWSLSASVGGDLKKLGLKVMADAPYIDVNKTRLLPETAELYESFFEYIRVLASGPDLLKQIADNLSLMNSEAPNLVVQADEEIRLASLTTGDSMRAVGALSTNGKMLPVEMEKVKGLIAMVEDAYQDMQDFIPRIPELIMEADIIGKQAASEDLVKPFEIFMRFHPGDKISHDAVKIARKGTIGRRKH
jgi:hypothetical protein